MKRIFKYPAELMAPIRNYLLHEQQKLMKRRDQIKKEDPFADTGRIDDNADIGQEANEQWGHQRAEALKTEVDRALINIRKSLTRIKIGKYGLCGNCGRMIDTDRLAINPTADLCIDCQKNASN